MLKIKSFEDDRVVFEDDDNKEYVLTCDKDKGQRFDLDIIEDILDYENRRTK